MALDVHKQDPLADNHSSSPVSSSTSSHLISSLQLVVGGAGVDVDCRRSIRTSNTSTCSAAGLVTLDLLNRDRDTSSSSSFASSILNTKSSSTSNSFSNQAKNQSFDFLKPKPKVIHKPPVLHQANTSKFNPPKSKQQQQKKRTSEDIIIMSQKRNMSINIPPKLDLRLNLSPPRPVPGGSAAGRLVGAQPMMIPAGGHPSDSPNSSSSGSPPSSCVSSDEMSGGTGYNYQDDYDQRYMSSPEATSMVLVGCPRCLMYVMHSEDDPRCPNCKSSVLLDFLNDMNNNNFSSGGNVFNNSYNYNAAAVNIAGTGSAAASGASKRTRRN